MPASASPQAAYLLVEATPGAASEAVPLNFCLVLDRSGSMQGAKLAAMKDATKRVIDTLTPNDVVSIVLFDDTVQVLAPATSAVDKDALKAAVDAIEEAVVNALIAASYFPLWSAAWAPARSVWAARGDVANSITTSAERGTWNAERFLSVPRSGFPLPR